MKTIDSAKRKSPVSARDFVPSLVAKGNTVKEFLNNLTAAFATAQQERDQLISTQLKGNHYGN